MSAWVFIEAGTGRVYLGFDADSGGCKSFVLAPNTGDIRFQENPSYSYTELTIMPHSFTTYRWYYTEVENLGGGEVEGRLYDEAGVLLNSLRQRYASVDTGGAAMRSFNGNRIDLMKACY